jgi:PhnB protein
MSTDTTTAAPFAVRGITPHLVCRNAADAIDFYRQAFGATEAMRLPMPDGRIGHAALRIGPAQVMLRDEFPEWGAQSPATLKGTPVNIHLDVDDVDAAFATALAAGARSLMEPADMFWGDRYAVLADPFGHQWSLATHQRDVSVEEAQAAMRRMGAGRED